MNIDTFSDLYLNIGERVKVFFNTDVFVQIDGKYADISYEEKTGDDWIAYESFIGIYCGERYKQPDFSLDIVKLRIDTPMRVAQCTYLSIPADKIKDIVVLEAKKPGVLDILSHEVADTTPRQRTDISTKKVDSASNKT